MPPWDAQSWSRMWPPNRGSLADGQGGLLVANTEAAAWMNALDRLIRHPRLCRELAAAGRAILVRAATLATQAESGHALWRVTGTLAGCEPATISQPEMA